MSGTKERFQSSIQQNYSGADSLHEVDKLLKNYYYSIFTKITKYCSRKDDVLDFGAGIGTVADLWFKNFKNKPDCVELDEKLRKILTQKGYAAFQSLNSLRGKYHLIYSVNVLEHIYDDVGTLIELSKFLKPNGVLVLYVPAHMVLYSNFDEEVGHYRRYDKSELVSKLITAGYKVQSSEYSDCLGYVLALITKLLGYKEIGNLGGTNSLVIYDRFIYPLSKLFDAFGAKYLFGKNLIISARK